MVNLLVRNNVMKQIEIWIQIYHLHFDWLQEYLGTIVVVVAEQFVSFVLALCRKIIHLPSRNNEKVLIHLRELGPKCVPQLFLGK